MKTGTHTALCLAYPGLECLCGVQTDPKAQKPPNGPEEYPHYFRIVSHLDAIDVYRILDLFDVADHAIGHAIKKLLVAGQRGAKDIDDDVREAMATLMRWQEMRREDGVVQATGSGEQQ